MHGRMVVVHCCIILHQVNTLSSRLNMDYSCTSKYCLTNQIEKTTTKIIIKMLMILDFEILWLWFVIEDWWYNTLTRENNWFLNVLVKSNFATPTPFGSDSCFVVWICLSKYNLNSFLIHQASYSNEYQQYLMQRENLRSIWKIGRYPIKVSEVLHLIQYLQNYKCSLRLFLTMNVKCPKIFSFNVGNSQSACQNSKHGRLCLKKQSDLGLLCL